MVKSGSGSVLAGSRSGLPDRFKRHGHGSVQALVFRPRWSVGRPDGSPRPHGCRCRGAGSIPGYRGYTSIQYTAVYRGSGSILYTVLEYRQVARSPYIPITPTPGGCKLMLTFLRVVYFFALWQEYFGLTKSTPSSLQNFTLNKQKQKTKQIKIKPVKKMLQD